MKPASEYFKEATRWSTISGWLFWAVTVLSFLLLLKVQIIEGVAQTVLIVASVVGVALNAVSQHLQNRGNQAQRATQFSDSFDVAIGDAARQGYYNTVLPPSVARLAVTTFENAFFTTAILCQMLQRRRIISVGYLVIWLLLMTFRSVGLPLLLLITQAVFSADVIVSWLRMERFCSRTARVRQQFQQFFAQGGRAIEPQGLAVALAALTDYECAKDEAAMPLNGEVFARENPRLSKEWEQLKTRLQLDQQ